jgi:hypothetical protein
MGEVTQTLTAAMHCAHTVYHKPGSTIVSVGFTDKAAAQTFLNVMRHAFYKSMRQRKPGGGRKRERSRAP